MKRATVSPKFQEVSAEIDVQLGRNGSSRSLLPPLSHTLQDLLILEDTSYNLIGVSAFFSNALTNSFPSVQFNIDEAANNSAHFI